LRATSPAAAAEGHRFTCQGADGCADLHASHRRGWTRHLVARRNATTVPDIGAHLLRETGSSKGRPTLSVVWRENGRISGGWGGRGYCWRVTQVELDKQSRQQRAQVLARYLRGMRFQDAHEPHVSQRDCNTQRNSPLLVSEILFTLTTERTSVTL
jgi:hypothetical protein